MKKHLTKVLKSCYTMFWVIALLFVLIYLSIYLSGIRHLSIGGVKLSFDSLTGIAMLIVGWTGIARDQIDTYLSTCDAVLAGSKRRQHRWSLRIVLWATWFVTYFLIYVYGQIRFAYLGESDIFDLLLVLLYGVIGIGLAIPMPKTNEVLDDDSNEEDNQNNVAL